MEGTPKLRFLVLRAGALQGLETSNTGGWLCGKVTIVWLKFSLWDHMEAAKMLGWAGRGLQAGEAGLECWCPLQAALPVRPVQTPYTQPGG